MIEVLKLMSCSADEQQTALPDFVVVADEIALLFDDELRLVNADASIVVREDLAAIDRKLSEMSKTPTLWTIEALRTASDWESLRTSAKTVLSSLGVAVGRPDLSWVTYAPAGKP